MSGLPSAAGLADVPDEIGIDERAQERGPAEDELGQDGVEGVVLLAAGDAEQGIDGHLEGGHAGPDEEERQQEHRVAGDERDEQGPGEGQAEGGDHDRLLAEALDEHARGDGHDAVGDEEGEGQEADERQAEPEALADVGVDGADDVGDERDDEKGQHHERDHAERAPGGRSSPGVEGVLSFMGTYAFRITLYSNLPEKKCRIRRTEGSAGLLVARLLLLPLELDEVDRLREIAQEPLAK